MGEESIVLTKLERQLIIYKYLRGPQIKEKNDLQDRYGIPGSTIYKDLKDIRDAGLIAIKWDREEQAYVEVENKEPYDTSGDTKSRVRHLNRLARLAHLMNALWNEPLDVDYYEGTITKGKSCKEMYQEWYPELSAKTMERDFQVFTRLGMPIRYNRELQYYEFYEEFDEDYALVFGVYYDNEDKKLKRHTDERFNFDVQDNHIDDIRDIRQGLNNEENW